MLLVAGPLLAQHGSFYGALTVARGNLEGDLLSRMNDRETFRLRQLAFLQIKQSDRQNLQLAAFASASRPSGSFWEGGLAFEYMLYDWLGIGKTFAVQQGLITNVQGYQTFMRKTTLIVLAFYPEAHATAQPGILDLLAFSRQAVRTKPALTGTYDLAFHIHSDNLDPFFKISGDPFTRTLGAGVGVRIQMLQTLHLGAEVFAMNLLLPVKSSWKYYPVSEYGVRFGFGVRLK